MFERFGELLTKEVQKRGFTRLDSVMGSLPSERHGAWEWIFGRMGEVNRYVIVGLMLKEAARRKTPAVYACEIAVGADTADRFVRHTIEDNFLLTEDQLSIWPKDLAVVLRRATERAERLGQHDLREHYLPSIRSNDRKK